MSFGKCLSHLAATISSIVEKNARVFGTNEPHRLLPRIHYGDRLDELVRNAPLVGSLGCRDWIRVFFPSAVDHRSLGALDSIPALIPIHGVVSSGNGRDPAHPDTADLPLQRLQ